jgi:hypothetical protein
MTTSGALTQRETRGVSYKAESSAHLVLNFSNGKAQNVQSIYRDRTSSEQSVCDFNSHQKWVLGLQSGQQRVSSKLAKVM